MSGTAINKYYYSRYMLVQEEKNQEEHPFKEQIWQLFQSADRANIEMALSWIKSLQIPMFRELEELKVLYMASCEQVVKQMGSKEIQQLFALEHLFIQQRSFVSDSGGIGAFTELKKAEYFS